MKQGTKAVALLWVLTLLVTVALAGYGQGESDQGARGGARLLLVDETKTFSSTMRVGALAGILRKSGMVDVSVKLVEVKSSYEDPLSGIALTEEPYDLILIIPRGIDDGSVKQIWLVSCYYERTALQYAAIVALSGIIDQIFQGIATATDVTEDLWPGFFAALYLKQGWLR